MEVIEALRNEGFDLWCDGENIHCRLRDGIEPNQEKAVELLSELKRHKAEAIRFLETYQGEGQQGKSSARGNLETILVFSHVLNREVFVSWEGDNPERVLFDGIPYTVGEIAELKKIPVSPDDLQAIHELKATFEGVIVGGASQS